ncbi:MAG: hypothetical protein KBC49_04030 [Candidatus Pacebacteria bacterium]|nr:hypothetical protein [Candidatus Paceibacterota bacterium]
MNLKNLFKKKDIRAHFTKDEHVHIKNPHEAWRFLLNSFFVIVCVVALLSWYKYYKIQGKEIESVATENNLAKEAIQMEKLDAILKAFEKKQENSLKYKSAPEVFVDPSR